LVGRARLNGSDVDPDLISIPQPVPVEPSDPTELDAVSLAVSGAYVYWSSSGADSIGRANANGGDVDPGFIELGALTRGGIAVDEGHLYWATEDAIGRANLDGDDIEPDFLPLHDIHVNDIAVADGDIYWTAFESHGIGRANIDGRHVNRHFITARGFPLAITVGGGGIYWDADETLIGAGRLWIARAKLNGADAQNTMINITRYGASPLAADALGPGSESPPTHHKPRHHGAVRVERR
jgi:streptogramin lyase